MFEFNALKALPFRLGQPPVQAIFKQNPEDFRVDELLGYDIPVADQCEHLWLQIEKRGQNTQWVAEQLAKHFKRPIADVSYAGLKDRQAVTTQWFSIRLADESLTSALAIPDVIVLQMKKAPKKLQRGALAGNAFTIHLRNVSDTAQLSDRFDRLIEAGVPNYFGMQRFGINSGNLLRAEHWRLKCYRPKGRAEKGFLLSAMRAWLFNLQVAQSIAEPALVDGFLFGHMRFQPPEEWKELVEQYQAHIGWLASQRCQMQKRALRVRLQEPSCNIDGADVELKFALPAGSYATSVLRELAGV